MADTELTADEVVLAAKASLEGLLTVQADYRVYAAGFTSPGVVKSEYGGLFVESHWIVDQKRPGLRIKGRQGYDIDGKAKYFSFETAHDGNVAYLYNAKLEGGLITSPGEEPYSRGMPLRLHGSPFLFNPRRSFVDILEDAETVELADVTNGVYELRCQHGKWDWPLEMRCWLDSKRGFTPDRIESRLVLNGNLPDWVLERDDAKEIEPGVWVSTLGRFYAMNVIMTSSPTADQTKRAMAAKTREEMIAVYSELDFELVENEFGGIGPYTIVVDPESIVVNEVLGDHAFRIDFPEGTQVSNELEEPRVEWDPPNRGANEGRLNVVLLANLAIILVALFILFWWRWRPRIAKRVE